MPSPRAAAAALVEAAPDSVLDGFSAAATEASPSPITNLLWPLRVAAVGDVEHDRQAVQPRGDGRVGSGDRDRLHRAARLAQLRGELADGGAGEGRVLGGDDDTALQFEQAAAAREDPRRAHPAREVALGFGAVRR